MKTYLLPNTNYYKAGLHIHTNISDGRQTPEEIKEIYKAAGYSVIAITDHQIMLPHPELNEPGFLTITGCEVAKNKGDYSLEPSTHFNVYAPTPDACTFPGFDPDAFWAAIAHTQTYCTEEMRAYKAIPFGYMELNKIIEACAKEGFLVCYNHPKGSLQDYGYYGSLKGLWGVECFNSGCFFEGYYESIDVCDDLWRAGERMAYPIAADDSHSAAICCHGWVMVGADALTYPAVFGALKRGDFYASTGVTIHELSLEDGVVHVETDGADRVQLISPLRFRKTIRAKDAPLTECDIDITKLIELYKKGLADGTTKDAWFRVELVRRDGSLAYTKAYFLDTLV